MGDTKDDLDYMLPANCPSPYFDTWDRHNSIAFSATKGLRNAPGENNCFVNCAVQVFWHLDVFRRSYRRLLGHTCMGNSCIFCALKVIFTQFQYSDKTSLHPDALRKALAETFANQQRFQLGHMDDAAECFENILRRIHFHIACGHNEDACSAPHCLPHQKFSMAVYEKVVCPCGASSSPFKFNEMVHYVSASALVSQSRMMQENGDVLHPDRFGLLLRKASAMGDVRDCPSSCGKQVQKQRTLLNIPDVVSVGLVWDSDHPSVETTTEVAGALGTAILLQDMYHRVMPDVRKLPRLQLVAVVCYYGKHYSTFVFHSKLKTWIYFDDATVREIGPHWENVVEKCSRGRFQPLLLLYANPSANPVSVETAPRKRVMAPGYAPEDNDSGLDRTQDSIKSLASSTKRSTTPIPKIPEHLAHPTGSQGQPQQYQQQQQQQQQLRSPEQDSGRDSPARQSRGEHTRQPSFLYAVSGKTDKNKLGGEGVGEGGNLVGGATSHHPRRQLLDGGANAGRLETMAEDVADYADYTLSSGDQYRRPSMNGVDSSNQLPMPPNLARYPDAQRKESFTKRTPSKEKGVDVVRYPMDSSRAASNRTPDFSSSPSPYPTEAYSPPRGGEKMGHPMKTPVHHGRQRSLSSGLEDESADMSNGGGSQHVVVKPKPTGHGNYDSVDAAHTPVQSGLATLPRNKAQNLEVAHSRQGSSHQEVAHIMRKGSGLQCRPVAPPLPPGTPPPEYNSVVDPNGHSPHSRQTSTSSQASTLKGSISMGCIVDQSSKKPEVTDKVKKKVKKEKKSEKDPSLKKSDKKKSKSEGTALKKSDSESDLLAASKANKYIDRRMVESILKHQGVHRQNSSCSNNSVSSVESDSLMGKLLASKASGNLTVDIPYDNMSIGSQKDSGYGGSDRNSSSSTGSGTIDPYTQYFISKSMVVPRSVNTQHLMEQQSQCPQQYQKGPTDVYGGQSAPAPAASGQREDSRKIMHPIKESSQEDFLRMSPNEPIGTQKFIVANATVPPTDARPPPVPPKNFAQFQIIKSKSQTAHERESSLDSLDKDDHINDRFVSLCKKADSLMDNCMLVETQDDMASALRYCNEALVCLKEAMAQKDLNNRALAYVQKKHNSCLLKSRTLQKRVPPSRQDSGIGSEVMSSVGNRSSVTSSDSDMSDQVGKHQSRLDTKSGPGMAPQHRAHPSQDSTSSSRATPTPHHERQSSATRQAAMDSSCRQTDGRSGGYRDSGATGHMHQSHSSNFIQGSCSGAEGSADMYGTLPRNKSRKPSCDAPASAEVYQSFLNKQKCLQAGVTSSQQSLDSVRSDTSGSDHSGGSGQPKLSKSEIRQMLQDKFAQRPQPSSTNSRAVQQQQYSQQNIDAQHYNQQPGSSSQQYPQQTGSSQQYPLQTGNSQQYPLQTGNSQQYPQQTGSSQQYPQQNSSSQQYSQQASSVQQYSQQQHRQDLRQMAASHRPGQNYGQSVPHSQTGHFPRPQQHSAHLQQHSSQPPQQNYHHQQYSQQQHHQQQHPLQQRQSQAGSQHHPPPHSSQPSHTSNHHNHQPPQQKPPASNNNTGSNSNGHPPVPSQKPSIPYPSSAAKSRGPPASSHGQPPSASRPDSSEVGRHIAQPNVARVTPHYHSAGAAVPNNSGNYLVMMPPPSSSSSHHQVHHPPALSTSGGQMRSSASAMNLGGSMALTLTPGSRPLERCASQPDCQKLVDSAYPANLSDQNASSYNGVRSQMSWASMALAHSNEQGHTPEGSIDSQTFPPPPADLACSETDSVPVSVRALASRFEGSDAMTGPAGSSGPTRHCSRHDSLKSNGKNRPQGPTTVTRTRSKSESFSRKPKSVLKNKKNKSRPRKSVTFADSLAHYSNCDDTNSGYESARELSTPRLSMDDRAYYSDDDERLGSHVSYSDNDLDDVEDTGSSNSDESPVAEEEACQLCNKRRVDSGKFFCAKCSFYMSRLKSS